MSAETIARALGGRRAGDAWMARCPAHEDRQPSLSIRNTPDGLVLVCCQAGCSQTQVIAALQARGLWCSGRGASSRPSAVGLSTVREAAASDHPDDTRRTDAALAIWRAAIPVEGTPAAAYLVCRGLHLTPPASLRFHPALKHSVGSTWPAMIALVTSGIDATPTGIHRTFLARDGSGKAPVVPQKMMLGPLPRWCRSPRRDGQLRDGRRRDRDLPCRDAGDRQAGLGGPLDLRAYDP